MRSIGRMVSTFRLLPVCWAMLRKDKELVALPFIATFINIATLVAIWLATTLGFNIDVLPSDGEPYNLGPALIVGLLSVYFLYVVTVVSEAAVIAGAYERLTGGDPTIGSAFRTALSRLSPLMVWAAMAATVGIVLSVIEEMLEDSFIGGMIAWLVDLGWRVVSFFVIPSIVIGKNEAIDGFKESKSLLRRTWGGSLIADVGFGIVAVLAIIPFVGLIFLGIAIGFIPLVALAVVGAVLAMVTVSALSSVFKAVLYVYATTGHVGSGFDRETLQNSFSARGRR